MNIRHLIMRLCVGLTVLLGLLTPAWAVDNVIYYHNDALGSPVAITDNTGQVLWREAYEPYGKRVTNAGGHNTLWYTGKPEDKELGLSYFGARWYDPTVGRFTGIDPVDVQADNIHSFNRYAYANNNPYRYVDPDGRIPVDTIWDIANVVYDLGKAGIGAATGNSAMVAEGMADAAVDAAATAIPYVPAGSSKLAREAAKNAPDISAAYKRPSGATTKLQRESVQGKPCVDCGAVTGKQVADHKKRLVEEYYETGMIDRQNMRSLDAVQPQCPTCSAKQGADAARYSRQKKQEFGL